MLQHNRLMRATLVIAWVFLLSACGFQLRGHWQLPKTMQPLFIACTDPYGQFVQELKSQLQASQFALADDRARAKVVLTIESDQPSQQLLGINASQQTRQYALIVTVRYSLQSTKGHPLLATESIQESRTITVQSNQILGSGNEIQLLNREMRRSLASTLLNRLSSESVKQLLEKQMASDAS